jgi:hypothetical protein
MAGYTLKLLEKMVNMGPLEVMGGKPAKLVGHARGIWRKHGELRLKRAEKDVRHER